MSRINPFPADARNTAGVALPAEFQKRRANRGMEGLTITPDQTTLFGTMQSTLANPNSAAQKSELVRIVSKTLVVDSVQAVGYPHDKLEGLWLIDQHRLGVLNDDDFALGAEGNALAQKYLGAAKSQVDVNTLFVIDMP